MPQEMPEYMKKDILERFNKSFEIKCKDCETKDTTINELVEALKMYVLEYEIWEKAVCQVVGRIPETGLHLALAKELIAKHQTP